MAVRIGFAARMEGVPQLALSTFLEWLVRVGPRWLVTRWLHITPERLAQ